MSIAVHWFRRDLRITDNTALSLAAGNHAQVIPVYIVSQWKRPHHWCAYPRQAFLCGCLESLHKNLEARSGRLIIRCGSAVEELRKLLTESHATHLYYNRDPDPFGRKIESEVATMAESLGVKVTACQDHAIHERDEVLTGEGKPYRVFTPYARAWTKLAKPTPGRTIGKLHVPANLPSHPLPTPAHWGLSGNVELPKPGESAARKRMEDFLDGPILRYGNVRDLPAERGTSGLSQDLRHGTLSIRELYQRCQEAALTARTVAEKQSVGTYVNELIWREFYMQVLWHWPDVLDHEFQAEYRTLGWRARWRPEETHAWDRDPGAHEDFQRWCAGVTGFPIVDAGMRQLNATGTMHNRVRMIVAMFLTKDLHLWWMHGESYFMQRLVDGEIASNNGGWQWSASTGTDAAPYFRIQNPWSQTKRYDPTGAYIRQWVPELRDVPPARFTEPPTPGLSIAKGYPLPMVDHSTARDRTLELFRTGS